LDRRLWRVYPGFESAFGCEWPATPATQSFVDDKALLDSARHADVSRRVSAVVDAYLRPLRRMHQGDNRVDLVICVVPDYVYENCRPESRIADALGVAPSARERRMREHGQLDLLDPEADPIVYRFAPDFRRQLKARAMEFGFPLQIIRQSTLREGDHAEFSERRLTPLCDRAWNLAVAMYYKAGGKPWRLTTARDGVSYVGLAYKKRNLRERDPTACCAAQMFLDTGDGIVFLGEFGKWFSPERKQCHLSEDAARRLLEGVLRTHEEQGGTPLKEVFIHCHSQIDEDEFSGFAKACPEGVKVVGVRVRQARRGLRLYREGRMPVLRGTLGVVDERRCYLWGTGFKPRLQTYDGWDVPVPLEIDIQHGDADVEQVARDIMGLTKLNYNSSKMGDAMPVTIKFSGSVGEILVTNPGVTRHRPQFKFYI
jgi:hypothetical protein